MDRGKQIYRMIVLLLCTAAGAQPTMGDFGDQKLKGDLILTGDEKYIVWYNGTRYYAIKASPNLAANFSLILPPDDGDSGNALVTDGSGTLSWDTPDGIILQVVSIEDGAVATGTTVIPADSSIPQVAEGDQYLSLAITPTSANSLLKVDVVVHISSSSANTNLIAALFRDGGGDAIAAAAHTQSSANWPTELSFSKIVTADSTSETTFTVRCGANSAGTTTFNGVSGGVYFGGVMASSLVITELYGVEADTMLYEDGNIMLFEDGSNMLFE